MVVSFELEQVDLVVRGQLHGGPLPVGGLGLAVARAVVLALAHLGGDLDHFHAV